MPTYKKPLDALRSLSKRKGYLLHSDVIDVAIEYNVGLSGTEKLTSSLLMENVLMYESISVESLEDKSDFSHLDYEGILDDALLVAPGLVQFIDYVRSISPPQHSEWGELILHAQNKNEHAYKRIFEMYLRTVIKIALAYHNRYDTPLEDCIQEGCLGLMTAIEKFDNQSAYNFSGYYQFYVLQRIQRNTELSNNPTIRLPIHYRIDVIKVYEIANIHNCEQCTSDGICTNLIDEISSLLGCSEPEARRYIASTLLTMTIEAYYIQECRNLVDDSSLYIYLAEKSNSELLLNALAKLKERERDVLIYRFGLYGNTSHTLEEVGEIFDVTRERIRQIEATALNRLCQKSFGLKDGIFDI